MNTKQGKLSIVAKTGGIKFDGEEEWYNPTPNCKAYVKPEYKGKFVEITPTEHGDTFSFIKLIDSSPINPPESALQRNTGSPVTFKSQAEVQAQIARHGALNTALKALEIAGANGGFEESGTKPSADNILQAAIALADSFVLPYVENK